MFRLKTCQSCYSSWQTCQISRAGHTGILAKIIPLRTPTNIVGTETDQYTTTPNTRLIDCFSALFPHERVGLDHPLFVTCRSGRRSDLATRMLVAQGFTNVWNLIEGFKGDRDDNGVRAMNGWRIAGLPCGYRLEAGAS